MILIGNDTVNHVCWKPPPKAGEYPKGLLKFSGQICLVKERLQNGLVSIFGSFIVRLWDPTKENLMAYKVEDLEFLVGDPLNVSWKPVNNRMPIGKIHCGKSTFQKDGDEDQESNTYVGMDPVTRKIGKINFKDGEWKFFVYYGKADNPGYSTSCSGQLVLCSAENVAPGYINV